MGKYTLQRIEMPSKKKMKWGNCDEQKFEMKNVWIYSCLSISTVLA